MQWKLLVVGKPALAYAEAGVKEYLPRLRRHTRAEVEYLKDGPPEEVRSRMEKAAQGCLVVAMDERGRDLSTAEWRTMVDKWELQGVKRIAVCIGGANGHLPAFRDRADQLICLGKATLQHELALVVLLEQIYRVYSLKAGEPYHRE